VRAPRNVGNGDGDQDADDQYDHHQLDEGESVLILFALHEALEHVASTPLQFSSGEMARHLAPIRLKRARA
jgi:hypothetical protein